MTLPLDDSGALELILERTYCAAAAGDGVWSRRTGVLARFSHPVVSSSGGWAMITTKSGTHDAHGGAMVPISPHLKKSVD